MNKQLTQSKEPKATSPKLSHNSTRINLSASDVLRLSLNDIIGLENQRVESIGRGNR